jgi:putative transposase
VKDAYIATQRTRYPVHVLCHVLDVSLAGFYDYLARCSRPKVDADAPVRDDLRTLHRASRGTYGRPRMVHAMRACGHSIGPKRVQRLLREEGLRGVCKGRFKPRTTDSQHTRPVAPNLLDRRFAVDAGVERHHLHPDPARLAVSGCRDRAAHAANPGLPSR